MKHLNEFNKFNDASREDEILSDISSLFCDNIDKFLTRDPDWKRMSDEEKKNFIAEVYELFINKYYAKSDLVVSQYKKSYLDELIPLLKNDRDKIIEHIVKEVETKFYPNTPV